MSYLDEARHLVATATDPEGMIQALMALLRGHLGDPAAGQEPSNLPDGCSDFRVSGGFFLTPDATQLMLVGNSGFPADQERLSIPSDGGDPGRVIATARPLLLADTRGHDGFRQYLKTARMGSAIYAPLPRGGEDKVYGLIIVAALAANSFNEEDLAVLGALALDAAARWEALDGPLWLAEEYHAADAAGRRYVVGTK
ncbi:GAF domain-containing protein [uncultured Cohaesibacter sp.]|uniref:GAF domain-containing protein n=1 Tax=uncultured Cohaesibacter sp. TaxID=1002546 RepID=UPI0029C7AA9E|nr:GAF domain-containing protein [uncultured Cohaesibacter sp.]